jgi:NADPH:quinone reductase-like Zn-dependent oxidoreductase
MNYKRVVISRSGKSEVLQVIEEKIPEPQRGEIRVKVLTAGVAFGDVLARYGARLIRSDVPPLPFTPGYDIVGLVDALGEGSSSFRLGQRVAALTIIGGYAEFVCLPEEVLVAVPEGVDSAEAVSLVLNYVTAYQMLHRIARVERGRRVLIHGAAGGVGTALLQLGRLAGLELYGTASQGKHALVESLGGTPIDYQNEDFVTRVKKLTGDGVDAAFDPIGGIHFWRSYQTLRNKGTLVVYGLSVALRDGRVHVPTLLSSFAMLGLLRAIPNRQMSIYAIDRLAKLHLDWIRQDLTKLFHLLTQKQIQPLISAKFPLTAVAHAHESLEHSANCGKIILISDHHLRLSQ